MTQGNAELKLKTPWRNGASPRRADADGIHAAVASTGADAKAPSDPVSWRTGAECEAAIFGSANARAENQGVRERLPARTQRAAAHNMDAVVEAGIRR